jgi:hypothetical protein
MDYNEIIKNYSEEKKDKVVELARQNIISMKGNLYHNNALNFFFQLWHEHFPQQTQSKHCEGCRQAVCKFFHQVADFIKSEREVPEVIEVVEPLKEKKPKQKTTKKSKRKSPKKQKTITGALSPTGARN